MERDQIIYRAERVAQFLGDTTIREVFASLEGLYFEQWKNATDTAARETLWAKCRALDELQVSLQAIVDAGSVATSTPTRD
jgi:hypothetical protein